MPREFPLRHLTFQQIKERIDYVLGANRRHGTHDLPTLLLEWVATEPSEYPTLKSWVNATRKDIHCASFQGWGGKSLWNAARSAFRAKGLAKAAQKAVDKLAGKYEKDLRIIGKLEDAIEKSTDKLLAERHPPLPLPADATELMKLEYTRDMTAFVAWRDGLNADAIKTLSEAVHKLTDCNMKLQGDAAPEGQTGQPDIYNLIQVSLNDRDRKYGVIEAKRDE